jgi:hypothetical protein
MTPFAIGYFNAAEWTTDPNPPSGPYPASDPEDVFTVDAIARGLADCERFLTKHPELTDSEQAGHDFWLTRNGHGAGFDDGDWPWPICEAYAYTARNMGECYCDHVDGLYDFM